MSAYVMIDNNETGNRGGLIFYSRATGGFYAATIGNASTLEIYRCTSINPNNCSQVGVTGAGIAANTWYFIVFQIMLGSGSVSLRADLYSAQTGALLASASYTDNSPLSVDTVGLISWDAKSKPQTTVYFDEAMLSRTDPRFVCVQNLPSDWSMEVLNGTLLGVSIATYACVQVFAGSPNGPYSTILRKGVVKIYDQANRPRASYPPSGSGLVIGGQIFSITPAPTAVRILDIVNNDQKLYYGILILVNYSQSGFSGINIRLCNPSTCSSQSISIPPPPSHTSEVSLPAGSVSNVSLHPSSYSAGATALIHLYLRYSTAPSQGGVVVSYPIIVILT